LEEKGDLVAAAIPAASAGGGLVDVCGASVAVHDVDAKKSRNEEEDGSQEKECQISSELVASVASSDSIPVPDGATIVVVVSKQSKGDHGSREQEEIHGPVDEASHKWQEEEERVQDADGGNDFGVNEALLIPCSGSFVLVQVLTCQASYHGGEGKLSNAEAERKDIDHKHDGGIVPAASIDWWWSVGVVGCL